MWAWGFRRKFQGCVTFLLLRGRTWTLAAAPPHCALGLFFPTKETLAIFQTFPQTQVVVPACSPSYPES